MNRLMFILSVLWDRPALRFQAIAALTMIALGFDSIWWTR